MAKKKKRKPTFKEFEKYVSDKIDEIRKVSRLQDWIIHYNFADGIEDKRIKDGFQAAASCSTSTEYNEAYITFYKPTFEAFQEGDIWTVDHTICHEIAHLRTQELYELARKRFTDPDVIEHEREKLTEIVSRYMHQILEPKRYLDEEY